VRIVVEDLISFTEPDDLASCTLPELRGMRDGYQAVENGISYARRMVQGRLDTLSVELERRASDEAPADLLSRLPAALAAHTRGPGLPRPPQDLEPPEWADDLIAELDALLTPAQLERLGALDDAELVRSAESIGGLERELSEARRDLHVRIDRIQEELIGRYRSGAPVDDLLA
jgi:hypothetical protein